MENDFGTISLVGVECVGLSKCRREYILKSKDVDKLNLITDAADGSTALCIDTGDLYILHLGEWMKAGVNDE